ncbi:MAG: hydrolase [Clostridiales bacterium]|nr:MAG: hydrolase [Clostridiales bacterium]
MRYKCLVLDHDDTAVDSTPQVHYPSFVETMGILRKDMPLHTLEGFILKCFEPGFGPFCTDILKMSEDEIQTQYGIWRKHTEKTIPDFFEGFIEMLWKFKEAGGILTVVSHSEKERILRDYNFHGAPDPDMVFGWDSNPKKRKPDPYPLDEIMKAFSLKPSQLLMVDDLKPGLQMARKAGVDFAAAGWAYEIPQIHDFMKKESDYYFETVKSFEKTVLY